MSVSEVPSHIIEVKRDGWSKGRGYVIPSKETGLIIHYLSEWERYKNGKRSKRPLRSYEEFVRKTYYWNQKAISRILGAAKEDALRELEELRGEFNSLLASGGFTDELTEKYVSQAEKILRR